MKESGYRENPFLRFEFLLIFIGLAVVFFFNYDFVPFYDSLLYYEHCYVDAARHGLRIPHLACFRHPSFFHAFQFGLIQKLDLVNPWPTHLLSLTWVGVSAVFLRKIFDLFSDPLSDRLTKFLLTIAYVFHPVVLSTHLSSSLDAGTLTLLIPLIWAVLKEKLVWIAVFGTCLALTKETGIVAYGVLIGIYFLLNFKKDSHETRVNRLTAAIVPVVIVAVFLLIKKSLKLDGDTNALHLAVDAELILGFLKIDFSDPYFYSYFGTAFLLNFNWVLSLFIVVGLFIRRFKLSKSEWLILLFLVAQGQLLTHVRVFNNPRYFLTLLPPLFILAHTLFLNQIPIWFRRLFVLTLVAGFSWSIHHSVDPISKKWFGTFRFGQHELFSMTSKTNECCGHGRDQLSYNLQTQVLDRLVGDIVQKFGFGRIYIFSESVDFHYILPFRSDFRRAIDGHHQIFHVPTRDVLKTMPKYRSLIYIEVPQFESEGVRELAHLSAHYSIGERQEINRDGYVFWVRQLALK